MKIARSSGLLLHITSLPGKYGIGTLGKEAQEFVDLLDVGGQKYWQILPIHPVSPRFGFSPYAAVSTFAGNPLFINLEMLEKEEWMKDDILSGLPGAGDNESVDFMAVLSLKLPFLRKAFENFLEHAKEDVRNYFNYFCKDQKFWLDDYSLYAALSVHYDNFRWLAWDPEIALRKPKALKHWRTQLKSEVEFQKFLQFIFLQQWFALKKYANQKGIQIIGDLPIYVNLDSADTWAHPDVFLLDKKTLLPTKVAGVPPDYYNSEGQRWGNPLYRWFEGKKLSEGTVKWWHRRVEHLLHFVDVVRLDHFRGFESFWAIPAGEKTAKNGKWEKGPGKEFFKRLYKKFPDLQLIAEDLGFITPEVEAMRDDMGIPGMKVLQFAFDGNKDNPYLPFNYPHPDSVVYTGTHDNNTTNGWFYGREVDDRKKNQIVEYLGLDDWDEFHWRFIRLALSSISKLSVVPAQDVLGFGEGCRMNTPGTVMENWLWKLVPGKLTPTVMLKLKKLCALYGRI